MSEDTGRVEEDLVDDEDLDDVDETDDGDGENEELSLSSLKKQMDAMASSQKDLLAEREELRKRLVKANAEAKKYRLRSKGVKATPVAKVEDEDDADVRPVTNGSRSEVEVLQTRLMVESVRSELLAAGVKGRQKAGRLAKLVDLDSLDYGDYGIEGLDEQIEQLKDEFPELFTGDDVVEDEKPRRSQQVVPTRKPVTADRSKRGESNGRAVSSAERLAKNLNRR